MEEQQWKSGRRREPFARFSEQEIFRLAKHEMDKGRCYLDPHLTMEALAGELNVHRNALSSAVNRCAGMSFSLWLNSYRVAEVERLVRLSENRALNKMELARQAGFSNRTSFYRIFKILKGATPSSLKQK